MGSLVITTSLSGKAQKISGVVTDAEQGPMNGTTVSLLKAKDSSVVKWTASQKDGRFSFPSIKPGKYVIAITYVNYKKNYSAAFDFSGITDYAVPPMILSAQPKGLSEVTVTSKKPIDEIKADKTILNAEGTINATGSDALELLRKSPGVLVDKDDNIGLNGKNGCRFI